MHLNKTFQDIMLLIVVWVFFTFKVCCGIELEGYFTLNGWHNYSVISSMPGILSTRSVGLKWIFSHCAISCLQYRECHSYYICKINDKHMCLLSFLFDEDISQNGILQCRVYRFKGECDSNAIYNRYSGTCVKCSPNCGCKDCQDIRLIHGDVTGQHSLKIDGRTVPAWCDMDADDGGWLVIQRRLDGSLNFYRGWSDYKTGFGNPSGEYWLGLENLYSLTSEGGYDLRIDMEYNSQSFYVLYSDFTIAPESDNYRMSYSLFKAGNTDNDLSWHNGQPFTTFDQDNDANEEKYDDPNCAVAFYGAWWYAGCHNSNLNGHYGNTSFGKGINWNHVTGYYASLSRVEMKIRKQKGS